MTISLKASADGLSGVIQIGGIDKVVVGATGLQSVLPSTSYVDDVAASIGGVPIGGLYHTTGTVKVRIT